MTMKSMMAHVAGAACLALSASAFAAPQVDCTQKVKPFGGQVVVIGDSFAHGLGPHLTTTSMWRSAHVSNSLLDDHVAPISAVYLEGQDSTGLTRADRYDWLKRFEDLKQSLPLSAGDIVIMWFGMNDGQSIMNPDGSLTASFGDRKHWAATYLSRLVQMDYVCVQNKLNCFLLAPTVPSSPDFGPAMEEVRAVMQEFAKTSSTSVIFDFASYSTQFPGPDRIHLTPQGYVQVAQVTNQRIADKLGVNLRELTLRDSQCK